eukprot:TRINITY_DN5149_c0_g2_i11.p1 TRINITY_DN5149_c0_g2~~TRINITY_DN5149_c0_g2_i11.p1  ORF type:complete len:453 (+),score=36.31 TRINITY_DN5149_c0_g2_i11:238-1596(+)
MLITDLVSSLQTTYDDQKKRSLQPEGIVVDVLKAVHTLESMLVLIKDNVYAAESMTYNSVLEPLLCCLESENNDIKTLAVDILTHLVKDKTNAMMIESEGYIPYLQQQLKIHITKSGRLFTHNPNLELCLKITNILTSLPLAEQHNHNVVCDLCGVWSFRGAAYKCLSCNDWDYCALCYCLGRHSRNHVMIKMNNSRRYNPLLPEAQKISHIYESMDHDEENLDHKGFICGVCGIAPIHGVRYACLDCQGLNMCQKCSSHHNRSHISLKFRYTANQDHLERLDPNSKAEIEASKHMGSLRDGEFIASQWPSSRSYSSLYSCSSDLGPIPVIVGGGFWGLYMCILSRYNIDFKLENILFTVNNNGIVIGKALNSSGVVSDVVEEKPYLSFHLDAEFGSFNFTGVTVSDRNEGVYFSGFWKSIAQVYGVWKLVQLDPSESLGDVVEVKGGAFEG